MSAVEYSHSRRSVLKRALLVLGGAVGIGAASKDARASMSPLPLQGTRQLTFHGRGWRLETPGRRPGEAIRPGDQGAIHGELLDRQNGKVVGRFYGSRLAIQTVPGAHANGGVEVHTFVFPGGTLVGMGTSVHGEAVFALVGGTGTYAGAQGSYVAKQRLREQGGNGTAEFNFTLRA